MTKMRICIDSIIIIKNLNKFAQTAEVAEWYAFFYTLGGLGKGK